MIALACTVIVCLTVLLIKHMSFTSKERRLLLNRIQGIPDDVVPKNAQLPQAVAFEDDAGYWEAQQNRPETS